MTLRIGARRSPLAVAQATAVRDRLAALGVSADVVGIDTLGDIDRRALTEIGGTGVFATAVREQLLAGAIDIAVHSLKDLPVAPAPGLDVVAIPEREDVRDVLVGCTLEELRDGAVIGTGSPRRAVQIVECAAARGREVRTVAVRGNVDSRLRLPGRDGVDAVLLAAAGLRRLGRLSNDATLRDADGAELTAEVLPIEMVMPAPGQGALAVEVVTGSVVAAQVGVLDHRPTRLCVSAERALLRRLEAGCLAPLGAQATLAGADLTLSAVTGRTVSAAAQPLRGESETIRVSATASPVAGPDDLSSATRLGEQVAEALLDQLVPSSTDEERT